MAMVERSVCPPSLKISIKTIELICVRCKSLPAGPPHPRIAGGGQFCRCGTNPSHRAAEGRRAGPPCHPGPAAVPALSIIQNGPDSFEGRKLGVLVSDGSDAALLDALTAAVEANGALIEIVAPKVGGFTTSDGKVRPAKQKVNGGPSVLYDAVAILISDDGARLLTSEATARDFVADAFAHAKFIAYVGSATPLLDKAAVVPDDGCMLPAKPDDAAAFIAACGQLRFWTREASVHSV
jgi:catalase